MTGTQTVTIPTGGLFTLNLPTTGDEIDEPNGTVTLCEQPPSPNEIATNAWRHSRNDKCGNWVRVSCVWG